MQTVSTKVLSNPRQYKSVEQGTLTHVRPSETDCLSIGQLVTSDRMEAWRSAGQAVRHSELFSACVKYLLYTRVCRASVRTSERQNAIELHRRGRLDQIHRDHRLHLHVGL